MSGFNGSSGFSTLNLLASISVATLIANNVNVNATTTNSNSYITSFTKGTNSINNVINYMQPNMSTNEQQNIIVGQSTSTSNSGFIGFNYQTSGSTSNYIGIGLYGVGNTLSVTATNLVGINNTNPAYSLDVTGTINSNMSLYNNTGTITPTFTTRSTGTKIVLSSQISANTVDYSLGVGNSQLFYSIPQSNSSYQFKWYAGQTSIMTLDGSGALSVSNTLSILGSALIDTDTTGSSIRARGLTINTTPNASFTANTDPTDTSRTCYLATNTANRPVVLSLRNLQMNTFWDIINEGTGNSRLLFQSYNNGTPFTPLTINGVSGNIGINQINPSYQLDVSGSSRITGVLNLTNTTNSISPSSGSLLVSGGIGSVGNLYIGSNSGIFLTGSVSGTFGLKPPASITSFNLTVPTALPTISGQPLISDTSGNLSFGKSLSNVLFLAASNVSTQTAVSGLNFNSYSAFDLTILVKVSATTNLTALFDIRGILTGNGTWNLAQVFSGDNCGIQFFITNSGQLNYTSGNYTGFTGLIFNYIINFSL
jgi:hypothetical protein